MRQTLSLAPRNPQTCPLQSAASPGGCFSRHWQCPPRSLAVPLTLSGNAPCAPAVGGMCRVPGNAAAVPPGSPSGVAREAPVSGSLERSGSAAAGAGLLVKLRGSRQCRCLGAHGELPCAAGEARGDKGPLPSSSTASAVEQSPVAVPASQASPVPVPAGRAEGLHCQCRSTVRLKLPLPVSGRWGLLQAS